jgi:hypothetical protein
MVVVVEVVGGTKASAGATPAEPLAPAEPADVPPESGRVALVPGVAVCTAVQVKSAGQSVFEAHVVAFGWQ